MKKQKKKYNNKIIIPIYILVMVLLSITLLFSNAMELLFSIKPDLSKMKDYAFEIHFVDVGQGDAILIRFPNNETMIVDSGEATAKNSLLYYIDNVFFNKSKLKKFNYAILSHSDTDHSGNMLTILNTYAVDVFYRPKIIAGNIESSEDKVYSAKTKTYEKIILKLNELERANKTKIINSQAGLTINNNNGERMVTFCTPNKDYYNNPNDYSPIIVLEYYEKKIMLTGDASINIEKEAINNNMQNLLDCDVLKLGHHGSKTSTWYESGNGGTFLDVVSPDYAVISVGENSYGHPSREVINNINLYSIENNSDLQDNVYETLNKGNIICYVNNDNIIGFITITNIHSYIFISWWVICSGCMVVFTIAVFMPKLIKHPNKGKK